MLYNNTGLAVSELNDTVKTSFLAQYSICFPLKGNEISFLCFHDQADTT